MSTAIQKQLSTSTINSINQKDNTKRWSFRKASTSDRASSLSNDKSNVSPSSGTSKDIEEVSPKSAIEWMKKKLFGKGKDSITSTTSSTSSASIPSASISTPPVTDDIKKVETSLSSLSTTSASLTSQSTASIASLNETTPAVVANANKAAPTKSTREIRERYVEHQQMAVDLITAIAHELELETSKHDVNQPLSLTTQLFCSQRAPSIPVQLYIHRLVTGINKVYDHKDRHATEMTGTGMRCLITGMIYLRRMRKMNDKFEINTLNVHRLILASFMCALKYSEDEIPATSFLTMLGGVSAEQFIVCESRFLKTMNYKLRVDFEEIKNAFADYCGPHEINFQPETPKWGF